jgi:hypothetical protein
MRRRTDVLADLPDLADLADVAAFIDFADLADFADFRGSAATESAPNHPEMITRPATMIRAVRRMGA